MLTGTTRRRCAAALSVPLLLALVVVHAATRTTPSSAQRTVASQTSQATTVRPAVTVEPAAVTPAPDLHWDGLTVLVDVVGVPLPHGVVDADAPAPRSVDPAGLVTQEGRAPPA
jgi:hypothetical protein